MPKLIEVTIPEDGQPVSIDLKGFDGVGCAAVMQAFTEGSVVLKDTKKPEYRRQNQNAVCK